MSKLEDQQALKEICVLLPAGYVKYIPFDIKQDVSFEFNGVTLKMSAIYLNEPLNCYMFDLAWGAVNKIFGIPIKSGNDILKQYKTPLPNMYAVNSIDVSQDAASWRYLSLIVIDESVLERG